MRKIDVNWIEIIFLLLFPGFFFYHALLARQVIPPFLGGFFGFVSLVVFPFAVVFFVRQLVQRVVGLNRVDILFLSIIFYSVCVISINYAAGSGLDYESKLFAGGLSSIILGLLMYFIGRGVNLESKLFSEVLIISLLLMSLVAIVNIGDSGIFYLAQEVGFDEGVATYQGFGRSLLVSGIFCLVLVDKKIYFTAIAVISCIALFVNGARTEFVGFILSLLVLSFIRFSVFKFVIFLVSATAALAPIFLLLPDVVFENSRVFELFNLSESSSYIARSELKGDAIRTILNNPVFGEYGSHVRNGEIGSGAHNILSAWVDFGIVGFLSYITLLLSMVIVLYKFRTLLAQNKYFWLSVGLCSYVIFALLSSKEHSYMLVGMTVGVVSRLSSTQVRDSNSFNNKFL